MNEDSEKQLNALKRPVSGLLSLDDFVTSIAQYCFLKVYTVYENSQSTHTVVTLVCRFRLLLSGCFGPLFCWCPTVTKKTKFDLLAKLEFM